MLTDAPSFLSVSDQMSLSKFKENTMAVKIVDVENSEVTWSEEEAASYLHICCEVGAGKCLKNFKHAASVVDRRDEVCL